MSGELPGGAPPITVLDVDEANEAAQGPHQADAHALFHRLWSKAVGTPGYDKAEWKRMEALLLGRLR